MTVTRVLRGIGVVALAFAALVIAIVALLQAPPVATWAGRQLLGLAPLASGHTLHVTAVGGTWLGSLELENVALRRGDTLLATVDWLRVTYNPLRLVGAPALQTVQVRGAHVYARRRGDAWDVAQAFRTSSDTAAGQPLLIEQVSIADLNIDAHRAADSTVAVRDLTIRVSDLVLGDPALLRLDTLAGTMTSSWNTGTPVHLSARGAVARDVVRLDSLVLTSSRSNVAGRFVLPRQLDDARQVGQLSVSLRAAPLALADLTPLVPALNPEGRLDATITAGAQGRQVNTTLDARLGRASLRLHGSMLAGADAPVRVRVNGELENVDPSDVLRDATPGTMTGAVSLALDGERLDRSSGRGELRFEQRTGRTVTTAALTADVQDGRAAFTLRGASGALSTLLSGWIRPFDSLPVYAAQGEVALPVADSVRTVRIDVSGEGAGLRSAAITVRARLAIGGGMIAAQASLAGDSARYRVTGMVERVDLSQLVADSSLGPVTGRFALTGRGFQPRHAVANARLELDDLRYRTQMLRGLALTARVRDARATIRATGNLGDGRLAIDAQVSRADSVFAFTVDSALLERVNLGAFTGVRALDGPLSARATARGRVGGETRVVHARVSLEPTTLAAVHVAAAHGRLTIDGARATYEVDVRSSHGALRAEARAADDSTYQIDGTVDSLNLASLLAGSGVTTRLGGRLTGMVSGSSLEHASGRAAMALDASRFNDATLGPGLVEIELAAGRLTGRVAVDSGDAVVNMSASGRLASGAQEIQVQGSARLARLDRWSRDSRLEGSAALRVDMRATRDSTGLRGATGTLAGDARVGDLRIDTIYAKLAPGNGLAFDTVLLRSNVARLDGAGPVALGDERPSGTFRLAGGFGDLSPLGAMLDVEQLSLDTASITLTAGGPAVRRQIALEGFARRLLYGNTLVEQLDARGQATIGTSLEAMNGQVELRGVATRSITVVAATLKGRYDSTFALEGQADFGHGVGVDVATAGRRSNDTTMLHLERLDLREGGRIWNLRQPSTVIALTHGLTVRDLDLTSGDGRVNVDGVVSFRDSSRLALQIEHVELSALQRAGLLPVPGTVTASLQLRGPPRDPELTGAVNLKLRDADTDGIITVLTWSRQGMRLEASAEDDAGSTLTVSGHVPWGFALARQDTAGFVLLRNPGDSLELAVRAAEFDIGLFEPFLPAGTARGLHGRLNVDAHVSGTPERAAVRGTAGVEGLGMDVPLTAVRYRNGRALATLSGARLRLDSLTVETGKNQLLTAGGSITLRPLTDPSLDLTAELRNFAVANEGILVARASGTVQVKGTLNAPRINGSLVMGPTEFNAPAAAAVEVEDVALTDEDRLELARHFGPGVLAGVDAPVRLLDAFTLDLDVRLPHQVWFRRAAAPKIDVEVSGRLRVRQQPYEEMQFFGTVAPLPGRSSLDLLGRKFELTAGDIALNGPIEQARVNVTAQYRPPIEGGSDDNGVIVTVAATGRLDSLGLAFSSDPSMSRDDIISYIVTGRPASDNPLIAQSSGSQGENLVFGQLSEALTDVVSRELGFDVFQIRQQPAQGLVLTAGRYVTSRFYVSLQQPLELGGDAKRLPGTTLGPGFELQYRLNPWLRVNMRGGSLATGILLRSRYAY